MEEQTKSEGDLAAEFRALARNLSGALRAAWESEERRKLHAEIEDGVDELASTIRRSAQEFAQSSTGQQLRKEVEDFGERLRSGEMEARIREDLLAALRKVNAELEKALSRWESPKSSPPHDEAAPER